MRRLFPCCTLLASLALWGCADLPGDNPDASGSESAPDPSAPLSFQVSVALGDGPGTTVTAPLPFSTLGHSFAITAQAIGYDHQPSTAFDGCLTVHLTSGILESLSSAQGPGSSSCPADTLPVSGGAGSATVIISRAYDQLRIWLSDEGTSAEPGSFATGSTQAIYTQLPTIAQVQQSDSTVESPLQHSYVPFLGWDHALPEAERRQLIVQTITNDGMYITDMSDPPGSFNSMFVFSFSRPEGVQVGDRLSKLAGIVSEFLGFTELQFPTWTVESSGNPVPEPAVLDPSMVCIGTQMEAWESSVIRVDNIVTDVSYPSDCQDYNEYGQWPAVLDGDCEGGEARINVVNVNTVPSWKFPECEDGSECLSAGSPSWCFEPRPLDYLVGVLRHTRYASPAWILEVRDCLDFPPDERPDDCAQFLMRPPSGPRHAPFYQRREVPECTLGSMHHN